ncbi:recombinase RecA [Fusobacterium sp. PH5-44]|uniref:recombinase RecA n=1 Tax=unclassified Fusobacterium TaxID=2648384 RepID=UPI003D1E87F9
MGKDNDEKKELGKEILEQKKKILSMTLKQIDGEFGNGTIMRLGENGNVHVEKISTGSLSLDIALGGGIPKGRIVEIYGGESSGKTTIALHILAEVQKNLGIGVFIDAEHALDPSYARKIGVDVDELLLSQPDYGEQALEVVDMLVRSNSVDIIVVDSVAALVPKAEIDGEMIDQQTALQARLMSKALRKITGNLNKSKTTLIFINQLRDNINTYGFGPQTTTTGGKALKFYSSVRMEVKRIGNIKNMDTVTGQETLVKITKNKVAPPFKEAIFPIIYGEGINRIDDIVRLSVEKGVIEKIGSAFYYEGIPLGQGYDNVKEKLSKEKDVFDLIQSDLGSKLGGQ